MQLLNSHNIHHKPTRKVGFVLKTHGFNGHLKLSLEENYSPTNFLFININNKFVPFEIEHLNLNALIVKLKNFNSIDHVNFLVSLDVVDFDLNPIDESDDSLLNYTLYDEISKLSFNVLGTLALPKNTLIQFRHQNKDCLIPFHEDFILLIDHEKKSIIAQFPDGILDL